jgi:hypothetical protein
LDVSYGLLGEGEEEDVKEIHMSLNVVTTISGSKTPSSDSPSTYKPAKAASTAQKTHPNGKQTSHSLALSKLDYDFLEDMKRKKDNISLFELMKLPQIQENFIKILQGTSSTNTQEANVGGNKGKGKVDQT